jgi:hypothetical protein
VGFLTPLIAHISDRRTKRRVPRRVEDWSHWDESARTELGDRVCEWQRGMATNPDLAFEYLADGVHPERIIRRREAEALEREAVRQAENREWQRQRDVAVARSRDYESQARHRLALRDARWGRTPNGDFRHILVHDQAATETRKGKVIRNWQSNQALCADTSWRMALCTKGELKKWWICRRCSEALKAEINLQIMADRDKTDW